MEYLFETKTPPIYEQINIYSTPNFHSTNNNNKPVPWFLLLWEKYSITTDPPSAYEYLPVPLNHFPYLPVHFPNGSHIISRFCLFHTFATFGERNSFLANSKL